MLSVGDPAPEFTLQADTGETISSADLRGSRVVVYFYPKDDTPGCTRQACAIRDSWSDFESANAEVFGISPDGVESHRRFREKFSLPFRLLADTDHGVAEAFSVWGERKNYGKTYMGIVRSSFVIDEEGRIAAAAYNVKPEDTTPKALAALAG
jgi:peroxiredoxin Q/BCP